MLSGGTLYPQRALIQMLVMMTVFVFSGHDIHVGDFIDGTDLLKELRTLNDGQNAFAEEA